MTTTKTEAKATQARTKPDSPPEEMQIAYQVHTLSQLIYDQLDEELAKTFDFESKGVFRD